ncbi:hypothetical protein GCM10027048_25320 [Hymenobacter coalescens]
MGVGKRVRLMGAGGKPETKTRTPNLGNQPESRHLVAPAGPAYGPKRGKLRAVVGGITLIYVR